MPRKKVNEAIVDRLRDAVVQVFSKTEDPQLVHRACCYLDRHPQRTWLQAWRYLDKHKKDSRTAAFAFRMFQGVLAVINAYQNGEIPDPE